MPYTLSELENKLNLRYQDKGCYNCRYLRIFVQATGTRTTECLLLGRTMGVSVDAVQLYEWAQKRLCDGWSKVPRTWNRTVYKNPFFHDPYIKRASQKCLRNKVMSK